VSDVRGSNGDAEGVNTSGAGKVLLLGLLGLGGLLLLNRGSSSQALPIRGAGAPADLAGALVDPGGGALVSPLSIPVNFPPYGNAGPGSSSVIVSGAAGALTAPLAGQVATAAAIANAAAAGGPNQTGRSSGSQVYGGGDPGSILPGSAPVYHPQGSSGGGSGGNASHGSGGGGYSAPPPAPKPPAPGPVNVQGQGRSSGGQTG